MNRLTRMAFLTVTIATTTSVTAIAAPRDKTPPPPPPPPPLQVFDANGIAIGRFAGEFGDGNTKAAFVALPVAGGVVLATMAIWQLPQGAPKDGLWWAPYTGQVFYATSNCSGPPVVSAFRGTSLTLNATRRSIVDLQGGVRTLYIGSDVPPSLMPAGSYRLWSSYSGDPSGFSSSSCADIGASSIWGVPTESVVDLDASYPGPLTIK